MAGAAADFLVVGSGIAGLYAAINLVPAGRVVLLTKERLQETNTQHAQGGIASALAEGDSPDLHFQDTVAAGAGLCSGPAVRAMVEDGPGCVRDLMSLGASFDRHHGHLVLAREGAHSVGRVLRAGGDATGAEIQRALTEHARGLGIELAEGRVALDLAVEGARVTGLWAQDGAGELVRYRAPVVILATGGAGQAYANTSNSPVACGDGMAMAWRAGAMLMDMEFFQFHPTALAQPGNPRLLISEAVRGEGAVLLDAAGRRFMPEVHPGAELAPRDVVARAIVRQAWQDGREFAWLDARRLLGGQRPRERFPTIYGRLLQHGIDMEQDLIPVAPAAHYCMGGIRTDTWARTSLEGLYACGEAACLGTHGANRLASNSLLESLVFARRAALSAAAWVQGREPWGRELLPAAPAPAGPGRLGVPEGLVGPGPDGNERAGDGSGGDGKLEFRLRELMWRRFGLIRDAAGMQAGLSELLGLAAGAGTGGPAAWRQGSLLTVGLLIAASAIAREESRGAHHRLDFPQPRPGWQVHSATWRDGDQLRHGVIPLDNVEVGHR